MTYAEMGEKGAEEIKMFTIYFVRNGTYVGVWPHIAVSLTLFQTLQFFEIVNSALGLVKSPLFTTAMQIVARNMVVWLVLNQVHESHTSIGLPMLFVTWSLAEISRFAYYALNLIGLNIYLVTWARYTFFIFNYPIGSLGEIFIIYASLPYIRKRKFLTIELPNPLNASFYFDYFLICSIFSSIYVVPTLYLHMLRQRKKALK
ncbi:very-long-chain (3R)-3-hydroxyacyl-CoA dehydratase 1-like protein [Dinothrombium tinctorium]|uniref:Very-long-chain (3R)-3-hydroxyacyl-CoA dehydratase n=1 Tax=Dinothrombium tinctorium TaxID=1965070 RepID=A0A3S3QQK6_9ACAR|nr:very-long-chain (3R)-3-hydroxyacyl-CoA dehydratase 1-like protein [Dinothrombium tinctorium]